MDKKCTACGKTVYSLEQLKCLDQMWHKTCFKCQVCGMTLNMKNYKGFEKKPYCNAHYPQPKAYTFVSDNPEMQRVKQNTAVISNVQYHSEFEKAKGKYTAVADDPESIRHRQNTQVVSNVKYHEDFEKSKGTRAAGTEQQMQQQLHHEFKPHIVGGVSYTQQQVPQQQQIRMQQQQQQQQQQIRMQQQQQQQQHHTQYQPQPQQQQHHRQYQPQPQQQQQQQRPQQHRGNDRGRCYRALYSYSANDVDEVSFNEGDVITNGDPIDEGWMYGVVERTGKFGMLPANYVSAV